MPPFHRMPVFYMALFVLTLAIGVRTWLIPSSKTAEGEPAATDSAPDESSPAPTAAGPEPTPVQDGILRTAEGLRRKVVVKDLDVVCRDQPIGGKETGSPLDYFAIRFVYGESPADHPTMVQVGLKEGPPQGWVPAASVLEWDTRLMVRLTPRGGRPTLVVYREESCLEAALKGDGCPRHPGHCPTEGEEATAEGPASALGWPILGSREAASRGGSTTRIFRVASLVRDQAPLRPPSKPTADLLPLLRHVDVAFVIDTTKSMQATIDAARRVAEQLVNDASRAHRDIDLRLALVEYRDNSPDVFRYSTGIVSQFTGASGFLDALKRIEAARHGDGTVDEAVLDGVARALPRDTGSPPNQAHLDWPTGRGGELATKMLVLLGDAPDHARDLVRARTLAALAKRSGITVATVALDRPGSLSPDERSRYQAQWHALAEGSFRPRDKKSGFSAEVAPVELRREQADRLVPALQSLIDDRIEHARNLAALAAAEAEGRLKEYVNSQGLTLEKVNPVLVDLHRGEPDAPPRLDPRRNGRKAPSVRIGWIAERLGGKPLVTVEILMSRDEIGTLIREMTQLQKATQQSDSLDDLLRIGNAAASGEASFLATDRGSQTFDEHLRRQGLPPARPDSLLRRTQKDLYQSDDLYRAALKGHVASALRELIHRRESTDWTHARGAAEGMALVPYAPFDF